MLGTKSFLTFADRSSVWYPPHMHLIRQDIGKRIKAARIEAGMTVAEVCDQLFDTPSKIRPSTLSQLENYNPRMVNASRMRITQERLYDIASVLNVAVVDLATPWEFEQLP